MRFLFVLPVQSYRGAEKVIATLTEALAKNNHEITILFLRKDIRSTSNLFSSKIKIITPPTFLNMLLQNNLFYTIAASFVCTFYLLLLTSKAEYILSDSFPCLWPSILFGRLTKKKVLWMIHSLEKQPPPNASSIGKAYFFLILKSNQLFTTYLTAAITNSPKVSDMAKLLFPKLPLHEILPPVTFPANNDPPNFRAKYHLRNRKIILCIGEIHPLKNQQLAVDAVAKIRETIPNVSLVLIGNGNMNTLRNDDLSTVELLHTGQLSTMQMADAYKDADVILQTSFYPEGLGLTPFEGLLFKKLPIVVEGSGAAIIIKQQQIGVVVEPSSSAIDEAICDCISHPFKYEYTIQKGYEFVSNRLTPKQYADQFIACIKRYE